VVTGTYRAEAFQREAERQPLTAPVSIGDLDVLVDGLGGLSSCRPAAPMNELALQGLEKKLSTTQLTAQID
jgi:hypothetical protein